MSEPPPVYMVPCVKSDCDPTTDTCNITCYYSHTLPPPHATSQSHVAPFLIATVCILGISFLLLTTCTIILRFPFTHRRNNNISPNNSGESPIDHDDDHAVIDHPIWHITTVGLQQSVIDSITTFKYKKLDSLLSKGSDCSVCLSQFDDGDDLRLLPKCCHAFHVSCIDTWLRSHKNCPLCRAPVVNESFTARSGSFVVIAEDLESSGEVLGEASGSVSDNSGGAGGCGELPLEGIRIAEVLKKNRELRILSDLAVNYRFNRDMDEDNDPIRRSFSFNALAATAICGALSSKGKSEGSSSGENTATADGGNVGSVEEKSVDSKASKRGTSMSGLLMLKRPVSMKRSPSTSSNGRLFSFRRSKSQASILPL